MGKVIKAVSMERCIGCDLCMLACSKVKQSILSLHASFIRIQNEGRHFLATIDSGRCDGCGSCLRICPRGCLSF